MKKFLLFAGMLILIAGCTDQTTGPGSLGGNVMVKLTATPGSSAGAVQLGKDASVSGVDATVDSLYVTSATIVLKDIAFTGGIDTVRSRDSVVCEREDDMDEHEGWQDKGFRVNFKGPFIVDMTNGTPTQITLDTIPPGTYNGIRFSIHRLRSRDVMLNPSFPDSLVGYSIVVRGNVRYSGGTFMPFVFKADINQEFKVKGNFVVAQGDNNVPYVLNFDMASWFKAPSGRVLDPNNFMDRFLIRWMIKSALGGGIHGGRDQNDDGHPDD